MRQAIILFKENMGKGSKPVMKNICMYIEMPQQALHLVNLLSDREKASFHSRQHRKFGKLCCMLERWETDGIEAGIRKHFKDLKEWEAWKEEVYFSDYEVHWQVFIQQDDGSWDFYLEQSLAFPTILEKIYHLAESMRKP